MEIMISDDRANVLERQVNSPLELLSLVLDWAARPEVQQGAVAGSLGLTFWVGLPFDFRWPVWRGRAPADISALGEVVEELAEKWWTDCLDQYTRATVKRGQERQERRS